MLTEDQLVDMLTQLASYLPIWGWGVVLVVAIVQIYAGAGGGRFFLVSRALYGNNGSAASCAESP